MRKSKLFLVVGLVVGLTFSMVVAAEGSYKDEASDILNEISSEMKAFAADKKAMNEGTKSLKTLRENAKKRQQKAFSHLKKVAALNAQANDMKFQFILHNVAEKWYAATKEWYNGLAGLEEKLENLGKEMTLISENMKGIGEEAQKQGEDSDS